MHRPPTPPPPVSVAPPPPPKAVLPPPVVPANAAPARSVFARVLRDIKVGGVCLLVGLVAGQLGLLEHLSRTTSSSEVALSLAQPAHDGDVTVATIAARSDNAIEFEFLEREAVKLAVEELNEELMEDREVNVVEDRRMEVPKVEERHDDHSMVAQQIARKALNEQAEPPQSQSDVPVMPPPIESLILATSQLSAMHPVCEDGTCQPNMKSHGTVLKWASTPAEAYRMADEQEKLVFMIHVSGNFEIPGFT